ncbi:MAG: hypothetical protein WCT03_14035 [Candidatus Obscuribacterales bacterium]
MLACLITIQISSTVQAAPQAVSHSVAEQSSKPVSKPNAKPNAKPVRKPDAVSSYSDLTEKSYRARERFEAQPKNPEAAYNFAVYQTMIGDRQYAQQIFNQAISLRADDFLSHLGLAQTIANDPSRNAKEAQVELARAEALALSASGSVPSRCRMLDQMGKTYLILNYPDKALLLYQKAYTLEPSRQILQMLVRSSLAAKKLKVAAAQMEALISGPVSEPQLLLLMAANCPAIAPKDASQRARLERFIFDQALTNFATDSELFYNLGRNFENAKCFAAAVNCFNQAVVLAPDEAQYVLAHCARLVLDNKRPAAQRELNALAKKTLLLEPSPRRAAFSGSLAAAQKLLKGPHSYKTSHMEFSYLSCNCKISAFNYLLRRLPGVVYARISEGKGPRNLVVYDPAITAPEKIWAKLGKDVAYKIAPSGSQGLTITSFPALVQTVLQNYEMAPGLQRQYYEFAPLPLLPIKD